MHTGFPMYLGPTDTFWPSSYKPDAFEDYIQTRDGSYQRDIQTYESKQIDVAKAH